MTGQVQVVFVHGTGVRDEGYNDMLGRVEEGLRNAHIISSPEGLIGLPWFRGYGVSTGRLIDTLPPALRTAAPAGASDAEERARLWQLLDRDSLTELRFLAVEDAAPGPPVVGDKVARTVTDLRAAPPLTQDGSGLSEEELRAALGTVLNARPFQQALEKAGLTGTPLISVVHALARATVAQALGTRRSDGGMTPLAAASDARRHELELHVADVLRQALGKQGVVSDWFSHRVQEWVKGQAAHWAEERRADFTDPAGRFTGDLLAYLRDSTPLLSYLREAIEALDGPKVLIGHSLGGIMLVDLMSGPKPPSDVRLLVTAGSQSPVLYLLGALAYLRKGGGTAFTPWLNIFDPRDLLAYYASTVLPGAEDVEVSGGVPFPDAHSAYWANPEVYAAISQRLQRPGVLA